MGIGGDVVGQAVVIGILVFLVSLGIGFAQRRTLTRSRNIGSSLLLGAAWGASWLIGAAVDLPEVHLGPPLSTILVVAICVVGTALSLSFFRLMLRDGSRED